MTPISIHQTRICFSFQCTYFLTVEFLTFLLNPDKIMCGIYFCRLTEILSLFCIRIMYIQCIYQLNCTSLTQSQGQRQKCITEFLLYDFYWSGKMIICHCSESKGAGKSMQYLHFNLIYISMCYLFSLITPP